MLKASEVMSRNVVSVGPEDTLLDAMKLLVCKKVSGLPVVDTKSDLIGIITEKDILNFVFSGNLKNTKVGTVMTREVTSFPPEEDVENIALAFGQNKFRRVPIVQGNKVAGIVSRRDIIREVLGIHCVD